MACLGASSIALIVLLSFYAGMFAIVGLSMLVNKAIPPRKVLESIEELESIKIIEYEV